jgi:hypothetical protein
MYSNPTGIHLNNGCNPVSIQNTEIYGNTSYGINSPSTLNLVSITDSNIHDNSKIQVNINGGWTLITMLFTSNSGSPTAALFAVTVCDHRRQHL